MIRRCLHVTSQLSLMRSERQVREDSVIWKENRSIELVLEWNQVHEPIKRKRFAKKCDTERTQEYRDM